MCVCGGGGAIIRYLQMPSVLCAYHPGSCPGELGTTAGKLQGEECYIWLQV